MVAIVQKAVSAATGAVVTYTMGTPVTLGNLLVVLQSHNSGGAPTTGWTLLINLGASGNDMSIWTHTASGADSTSFQASTGQQGAGVIYEISGFSSSAFDVEYVITDQTTGAGTSKTLTSTNPSTIAGGLALVAVTVGLTGQIATLDGSWTSDGSASNVAQSVAAGHKTLGAIGTISVTATWASPVTSLQAAILSFIPSASAGGSTLNPSDIGTNGVLSNGNLTFTTAPDAYTSVRSTTSKTSGKWVFEATLNSQGDTEALGIGVASATAGISTLLGLDAQAVTYDTLGFQTRWNAVTKPVTATINTGETYMVAVDLVNHNVFIRIPSNTFWDGLSGDNPATNTGGLNGTSFYSGSLTTLLSGRIFAGLSVYGGSKWTINFGDTPFVHAAAQPTGFLAWDATASANTDFFFAAD